jgi:hypothetical protein
MTTPTEQTFVSDDPRVTKILDRLESRVAAAVYEATIKLDRLPEPLASELRQPMTFERRLALEMRERYGP